MDRCSASTRRWATSTGKLDLEPIRKSLARPAFMIKIIPHVDCTPRICELVRYYCEDVTVKGAWSGPAALQLLEHAMCDVARLPVREVMSATHFVADLTLALGEVVFDYLKELDLAGNPRVGAGTDRELEHDRLNLKRSLNFADSYRIPLG
jgi:acetoacetate decarboxylase